MADRDERNHVFISYSHKDKKFLDELLIHLKPLERAGFDESRRSAGFQGLPCIRLHSRARTRAFVKEQAEQGGVQILWTLVRACAYKETPLANYQAVIPPDKPLAEMKAERDKAWVRIYEEIKKAVNVPNREGTIGPSQTPVPALNGQKQQSSGTLPAIADISKQLRRLKMEWTLNQKNTPGVFDRASAILKKLHATVIDFYTEIAEGQNPTAVTLVKSALDQIAYIENAPTHLSFDLEAYWLEAYWNEGREIFDLLQRAQECLEAGI
jgi:hypothetical protein